MLYTALYFLWVAYTVGSLSFIALLVFLSVLAKWENKKHTRKLRDLLGSEETTYKDGGW